ncbi:MAG: PEP-utilizing enzyme [Vulcanimicrobiota bacterium]
MRESARHWLMHGWAEIRRTLLALDQRLGLEGGVFWLTPSELETPDLDLIASRRRQHRLLQSIHCPSVIYSDDLEAIGRAPDLSGGPELCGTSLSWGNAEGPALVVERADQVPAEARDYILVCPSTDPAYTSAMSRARALVVATGGVLSHGAIVARELGLPAVSNVSINRISPGQQLRVDGARGSVTLLS